MAPTLLEEPLSNAELDPYYIAPPRGEDLPYDDGEPLESSWHRDGMYLLIEQIEYHLHGRDDFYVGGNMFIHFSTQTNKKTFRGPDFFTVLNVPREPHRRSWVVWEEGGRYPDVVVEILSDSTEQVDRVEKFELYRDVWKTQEYFLYDFNTYQVEGWRLTGGSYEPIQPDEFGHLPSLQLGLALGSANQSYLKREMERPSWFTTDGVPVVYAERLANIAIENAENERLNALAAQQRADGEKQRADGEKQRADGEKQRADQLQAELDKLRAVLHNTGKPNAT